MEKFPFDNFEISDITSASIGQKIIGNLTLKKITNSITIPVKLRIDEKYLFATTPTFTIDRTRWGIVYNSGIIGTIKDALINDEIFLRIKIVTGKDQTKNQ